MAGKKGSGIAAIDRALDAAKPAPQLGRTQNDVANDEPELPLLPPGCPVTPLGVDGQTHYYLDERRQLIGLDPQKHGKTHILALFGRKSPMCLEWLPRIGDGGRVTGWRPEDAARILMQACSMAGIFNPQGRVRGRGAWLGEAGELVLHVGDKVYMTGEREGYHDPELIGRYVYPAGPELPRPHHEQADPKCATWLLDLFNRWHWSRPLIDPMLLLGWNAAAMIGGALEWRPHAWVTGSTATGKSTLQKAMNLLHDGAALETADATEAALRQILKQDSLPVFFDEAEAEEDNRRNKQVTKLARLASSGGQALRGSQTHDGHGFTVRSCFLFSSILLPPMLTQDKNRLAILELEKLPPKSIEPILDPEELRLCGQQLRRRLVDHWPRYPALYKAYAEALAAVGHGGRGQKQFGTLLALADLLLYDVEDLEVVHEWAQRLSASTLAEKAMDIADEEEAIIHLASSVLPGKGGDEPEPISRTVLRAVAAEGGNARERLENNGMRVVAIDVERDGEQVKVSIRRDIGMTPAKDLFLAIADGQHVMLERLFRDKRWSEGTWSQSFRRVEGAHKRIKVRIAGTSIWTTLVPLKALLDFDEPAATIES